MGSGKKEIEFFLNKITELRDTYRHKDDLDNVVALLCDRDSDLYQAFRNIVGKTNHEEFCTWLSTFLYSSRRGENFNKLCQDKRIDTSDFMSEDEYAGIWRQIRDYGKGSHVHKRAWQVLEDSFNSNFVPDRKKDEIKTVFCVDDDKVLLSPRLRREMAPDDDAGIAVHHHVRDNRKGHTVHAVTFAASGMPLHIAFQKCDVGLFDTVVGLFEKLFNAPGPNTPLDLTN